MIIREEFKTGKVELKTNTFEKVSYEKPEGLWYDADYKNYMNMYEKKLITDIKRMGKWAKFIDMREYKMSNIVGLIQEHLKWCKENGLEEIIFLFPENFFVKSQMGRSCKDIVNQFNFDNEQEAKAHLKETIARLKK